MKSRKIRRILQVLIPDFMRSVVSPYWIRCRWLRLEKTYFREMVADSEKPKVAPPPIPRLQGQPLRRMVLIADIMWESGELVPELAKICEVDVHDIRPVIRTAPREQWRDNVARNVADFIAKRTAGCPDLVLLYLRGNLLSEELFTTIRHHWSCPVLGMNLDDRVTFWDYGNDGNGDHHQKWARFFDLNLTNSKIAATWYHQAGAACLYTPAGVHIPPGLGPPTEAAYKYQLSFLGSPKLDREILVNRLNDAGLPVALFGKGWPNGQWVDKPSTIYRESQINLGLGMATVNLSTTKNRDFECPGVGACYITSYNWELPEWWDLGREILCYRNVEELIEMICWYRNRPDECLRIAQAAWNRCAREHTWEIRLRKLFRELGFSV